MKQVDRFGREFLAITKLVDLLMAKDRQHVMRDLAPYLCVFEDCHKPLQVFRTSDDWISHMQRDHMPVEWLCLAHTPSISSTEQREMAFHSEQAYKQHVREEHPNAVSLTDADLALHSHRSSRLASQILTICPFCGGLPEHLGDKTRPDQQSDATQRGLQKHVGEHLQSLSLISLPWDYSDLETAVSSNEALSTSSSSGKTLVSDLVFPDFVKQVTPKMDHDFLEYSKLPSREPESSASAVLRGGSMDIPSDIAWYNAETEPGVKEWGMMSNERLPYWKGLMPDVGLANDPNMVSFIGRADRFHILEEFNTGFLIDDSPSMQGEKWELVQRILHYSTVVVCQYDPDGVDVRFMNNTQANVDGIKDPHTIVEMCHNIELRGSTPILDRISHLLRSYLQNFKAADYSADFQPYQLVVLTDGEPNEEYEDKSDISDQEDAEKTPPAFRLLRKRITEVAKKLNEVEARSRQICIQFCQIGDDERATMFFEYLDDQLKGRYGLGRDVRNPYIHKAVLLIYLKMVDTIKCQSEQDLTLPFYEKLLLGAIESRLDHRDNEYQPSPKRVPDPLNTYDLARIPTLHPPETAGKGKKPEYPFSRRA